jgi:hypothetical protein
MTLGLAKTPEENPNIRLDSTNKDRPAKILV